MLYRARARKLGLVLSALVASVAVAACGSSSGSAGTSSQSAQSLLQETFGGAHTFKSGVIGLTLTMNPSGSRTLTAPVSFSLTGPFESRGTGKLPASDFTIGISALGRHGSLGVISTGTNGYVTLDGTAYQLPAADFQRLDSSFSGVRSSPGGKSGLSGLGIDPLRWLQNPSVVGSGTIGGVQTTHIRAGVNVSALLADLNTLVAKAAKTAGSAKIPSSIPAATQQKIAAAVKDAMVDIWTGQSDRALRKLSLTLSLPVSGQISSELGGLSSAGLGLTLQYSDLNQPQSIPTPTNVKPYSQFTAKLQGAVSALEGGLGAGVLGSSSSGSSAGSSAASNVAKYSQCIEAAGQSVVKMQKCAPLLNGK